jgi:hypothetical protein
VAGTTTVADDDNGAGAGTVDEDANANANADTTVIEDEQVPLGVNEDEETADDAEAAVIGDTNVADEVGNVEIEDEETPLAGAEDTETVRKWYWWILLIIAAITGKTGYDKKHKKNLFAEKEEKTK